MNYHELLSANQSDQKLNHQEVHLIKSLDGWSEITSTKLSDILNNSAVVELMTCDKWHVWTDFDGVFTNPWNDQETFRDLRTFQKIVAASEELTVFTAKTLLDYTSPLYNIFSAPRIRKSPLGFFIYPQEKYERFLNMANKVNPQCRIKVNSGIHKLFSQADWRAQFEPIRKSLEDGNTSIIIGSSVLDRRRMFALVDWLKNVEDVNLENLFYFNTKHILI